MSDPIEQLRGWVEENARLHEQLKAAEAREAALREALEKYDHGVQFHEMHQALEAAQDIAVRANDTPPISDPRWAKIADAVIGAHDPFCSLHDAGGCNCFLSRQALAAQPTGTYRDVSKCGIKTCPMREQEKPPTEAGG